VSPRSQDTVRAAVPRAAVEIIAGRAPDATVVAIEDQEDLRGFQFLVPVPNGQGEFAARLAGLPDLRVVQTLSAGVDALANEVPAQVTLCSARGARDGTVAEWVLGALLGWSSRMLEGSRARSWGEPTPLIDLAETTVLIVGMGSIGRAVADRLSPFGAEIVPVASRARDGVHAVDELPELLARADAVVLLTPLTDATRGLIDATALSRLRDGALLINAARGAVVDTGALLAEVTTGRIHAVLDVTDPEPLPDDHPLWQAPGVLAITPHIGGNSPRADRLASELAGDQLARFCAGEALVNLVSQGESP
jgi:phosphoglycerate dehydrogenase-like enzyme